MTLEILTFKYSIVFISDTIACPSCHLSFNLPVINQNLSIYLHRVLKSTHAPKHLQEVRAKKCTDIYTPLHGRLYWCTHTIVTTIQTTTILMKIIIHIRHIHSRMLLVEQLLVCCQIRCWIIVQNSNPSSSVIATIMDHSPSLHIWRHCRAL